MEEQKKKRIILLGPVVIVLSVALGLFIGYIVKSSDAESETQAPEPAFLEEESGEVEEIAEVEETAEAEDDAAIEGEVNVELNITVPDAYTIEDFPIILQMPELPTGCEITALTMVLRYYGYDADKTVMASEYLPTMDAGCYYGADGRLYGNDLRQYFIGNPFTEDGIVCGTGAIVTAANNFLGDQGSSLQAVDITGTAPEDLYSLVSMDIPIVVWVTIEMVDREVDGGWYTEDGTYVEWSTSDHGAVLIGYSEDTVVIADPISGEIEYSRGQFESVFESRSRQCVMLE